MNIKPPTKQQSTVLLLVVFSAFLTLLRVQLTQNLSYTFLLWNMFLAVIPYMIAEFAKTLDIKRTSKLKLSLFIVFWLLFLPNAPYIITDFIHFNPNTKMAWYDLFLLFTNASTGLILALLSVSIFNQIVIEKWTKEVGNYFSIIVFFLCGFGIYLGRFLRFNSWDIIFSPFSLIKKSMLSFTESTAWLITIGFGSLLWILFSLIKRITVQA